MPGCLLITTLIYPGWSWGYCRANGVLRCFHSKVEPHTPPPPPPPPPAKSPGAGSCSKLQTGPRDGYQWNRSLRWCKFPPYGSQEKNTTDGVCMTRSRRPLTLALDMTGSCFRVLALHSQRPKRLFSSLLFTMVGSLQGILSPASALQEPTTTTVDGYCPAASVC